MTLRSLAAWLCLILATPASAAEIALVGSHHADLDASGQERLMASIAKGVDGLPTFDAVDLQEVRERVAGREDLVLRDVFESTGAGLLSDARSLYLQAQPDALPLLEAAIEELEASVAYTRDVQQLWDAAALMAAVQMAQGDDAGARDAVTKAIVLLPSRLPDPAAVPPPVVALFEEVRGELLAKQRKLVVDGDGLTQVWVDGRPLPDKVRWISVPPGRHHIHGRDADGRVAYTVAEVGIAGDTTVSLELEAPRLGEAGSSDARRSQDTRELYLSLGRVLRTDLVLLMGQTDAGLQLQLHAPEVGGFGDPIAVDGDASEAEIAGAVVKMLKALPKDGAIDPAEVTFTALPLSVPDNQALAGALLAPGTTTVLPTPTTPATVEPTRTRNRSTKPIWPVAVGVGAGVAVATAVTLGVVLGGGKGSGGTVVFGAQP